MGKNCKKIVETIPRSKLDNHIEVLKEYGHLRYKDRKITEINDGRKYEFDFKEMRRLGACI